jgi:hypothetical protein
LIRVKDVAGGIDGKGHVDLDLDAHERGFLETVVALVNLGGFSLEFDLPAGGKKALTGWT